MKPKFSSKFDADIRKVQIENKLIIPDAAKLGIKALMIEFNLSLDEMLEVIIHLGKMMINRNEKPTDVSSEEQKKRIKMYLEAKKIFE